jgi:predicted DNA-binding protein
MAATATIRVTRETRDRLNRISSQRGMSAGELVDELATHAEDQVLLAAAARHYDELKADPEAWESYRAEMSLWEQTVGDGISVSG